MTRKLRRGISIIVAATILIGALTAWWRPQPDVKAASAVPRLPKISPDYAGITIPPNIAPLNFMVCEQGRRFFVRLACETGDSIEVFSDTPKILIPAKRWRTLLGANRGKELRVTVYTEVGDKWQQYEPIVNRIAHDEIDGYIAYRLIEPVHARWHEIAVKQRDLTSYRETEILNGIDLGESCVNCHSFAANDPKRMSIAMRSEQYGSATILAFDGEVKKLQARFGYTAWHPSGQAAAYSVNQVAQFYHSAAPEVRDVIDVDSALAYYLVGTEDVKLVPAAADKRRLETYPAWSPDGRYLYYCSAPMLWDDQREVPPARFAEVKYDLMRVGYDLAADRWGEPETVLSSQETNLSILEPRISPDGRFLLFCMCRYGCFPAYQPTSDLYMMDLDTRRHARLDINSEFSESWHSWSSNGRWIAFSSKRRAEPFTRCYLSFVDDSGKAYKPFVLPQYDPEFYDSFLKTVSVPELITGPVPVTNKTLAAAARSDQVIGVDAITGATRPVGGLPMRE
ncbi:MAG: hypothetical protein GXX96_20670 [Planctomycetaceae bacterium]|nr:hypothetical protein [Planctomycetaceae bacterium]